MSQATDAAVQVYKDKTPPEKRTTIGVWKTMSSEEEKTKKSYWSKSFEKYIAVANSKNCNVFFDKVLNFLDSLFYYFGIIDYFLNNVSNYLLDSCRLINTSPITWSTICIFRCLQKWQLLMLNLGSRQSDFSGEFYYDGLHQK